MICLKLFLTFFKIGAFTFGGGYAMLRMIQEEVLANGWLSEEDLINFVGVSESTPGPFAVNISTYIGSQKFGILGALCATLGVVLPSFLIILLVARFYEKFKENKIVSGCMSGLKPAAIGLLGSAAISIAATVFVPAAFSFAILKTTDFYVSLVIFVLSLILVFKKVHPIILICLAAALGIGAGYLI